jgi:D-alanyl-lipoteichoic acid acyltransferase DltB (MBOAT superfamily)
MTELHIGFFILFALFYLAVIPPRWRSTTLVFGSVIAAFWLQPEVNIRWLDFSLTGLLLFITLIVWWVTLPTESRQLRRADVLTCIIIAGIVILLSLARHIPQLQALNITSRPPPTEHVIAALISIGIVFWILHSVPRKLTPPLHVMERGQGGEDKIHTPHQSLPITQGGATPPPSRLQEREQGGEVKIVLLLIALFVMIKTEALATLLSSFLRLQSGQDMTQAAAIDIQWIGFSYVAFRLLHTLRDRQSGILPLMTLQEFLAYGLFFPAFTAGPIDRAERFLSEFRALAQRNAWDAARIFEATERIVRGMVKKFVIADTLALFALNDVTALQAQSSPALWLLLYAYALRLYFDFSGYTDIAIGLGLLFGIRLPDNFNAPYLKNNIALFWQSWHITLSQWVRFYVYTPLSRALLRREKPLPSDVITMICHLTTMLIIGAWHGVTVPFLLWGAWHGTGLIIHKLWSDRTRRAYLQLKKMPRRHRVWTIAGTILTFHFVCLGWVWFSLSETAMAWDVLRRLLFIS